jgi:hypothetical protein
MVFAALRKGGGQHRTALSPNSYFDPASPDQKRRAKERLQHPDLGCGLLHSSPGGGHDDDATSEGEDPVHGNVAAYTPLNVQELEQSIHSRFSHHSKTSGSSSGAAPLPQSLQQELDDFASLLNRHATEASSQKVPSKWGSPSKENKPQLFPTLQRSKRDLLAASHSSHHSRVPTDPSRLSVPHTAIGPTRPAPPKEQPVDMPHRRRGPPEDRPPPSKSAPKQATIARRRMTRKHLLPHSDDDDDHSCQDNDSFFDDPTRSWEGRSRTAADDPSRAAPPRSPTDRGPVPGSAEYASPPARNSPPGVGAPHTTMTTQRSYLALEQGDWASLLPANPLLIKSPEGKLRPTIHGSQQTLDATKPMATGRSVSGGSSSSEEDSVTSRNTRDTGIFSEDELELEINSSDEDEDDEKMIPASAATVDVPESPEVRRQVARMTSGQLRRWDGFHEQVVALVKVALPDQAGQVSALMKRFAGREAELIQTLQTMCRRLQSTPSHAKKQSIHHSRGLIARTGVSSPRRISAIAGRKMDALARIAAANTLDDQTRAVKPEYVVDDEQSFWQNSKSGSSVLNSEDLEDSDDSYSDEEPYGYGKGNRRSEYDDDDDEADGYESYEDEEGSDYEDDDNYEDDDYEQEEEEEEAYTPSDDDDSSASGYPDAAQWR